MRIFRKNALKFFLELFFIIIFSKTSCFSQTVRNNINSNKAYLNLSQKEKNEKLWELCSKHSPDLHDLADFKLLVKAGADVNYIKDNATYNLLFLTIAKQNGYFIEQLLQEGCNPNYIYRVYKENNDNNQQELQDEKCLIYYALDNGINFSLIKEMIEYGSSLSFWDFQYKNNIIQTAFTEFYSKESIIYLLEKGAPAFTPDPKKTKISQYYQPIITACKTGNIELVQAFIDHGADIKIFSTNGPGCCLNAASYSQNLELINYCLEKGCKLSDIPDSMFTPLDYALANCNEELTDFFIKKGVNINHLCTKTDETFMMQYLHRSEIDLYGGRRYSDLTSCYFALKKGADPLIKDKNGKTVIDQTINKAYRIRGEEEFFSSILLSFATECIKLSMNNSYKPNTVESILVNDKIKLLKNIKNIQEDSKKYDLFYYAAYTKKTDCLQVLFDNGIKPTKDSFYLTLFNADLEALKIYKSNNVDFNSFNNDNVSRFSKIYSCSNEQKECLKFIVDNGYDINKESRTNRQLKLWIH